MMSQQEVLPLSIPSSTFLLHPNPNPNPNHSNPPLLHKKKRNLPGTPDPDAEVVALSPKSLMATDRFVCEICRKGFRREQNLQLHRRGHNLPWKLKQRSKEEVVRKKVYVCPEKTCVHHEPSRALGDLTGIKKHFSRKHGEKKWKCQKCSKKYAVQSDWKAHSKVCGTREYKCDCGTIFSRKDSFITHRAFCDALAEERGRITRGSSRSDYNYNPQTLTTTTTTIMPQILGGFGIDDPELGIMEMNLGQNLNNNCSFFPELMVQSMDMFGSSTANIVAHGTLKEEAEEENSTTTTITTTPTHSYHHFNNINSINLFGLMGLNPNTAHHQMGLTRDFLGVGRGQAMGAPFLHHGSSSSFNTLASALDDLTHYNSAHH